MNKQEMLEVIQDKIGDKTLSFGCIFKYNKGTYKYINDAKYPFVRFITINHPTNRPLLLVGDNIRKEDIHIIGHDVYLGDCDKLIEKGPNYFDDWNVILDLWTKKDKPITEQSEECIEYIFNLIKE